VCRKDLSTCRGKRTRAGPVPLVHGTRNKLMRKRDGLHAGQDCARRLSITVLNERRDMDEGHGHPLTCVHNNSRENEYPGGKRSRFRRETKNGKKAQSLLSILGVRG